MAMKGTQHPKEVTQLIEWLTRDDILGEFSAKAMFIPGSLSLIKKGVEYPSANKAMNAFLAEIRPLHRAFLKRGYEQGLLLCSGPMNPLTGGMVVARAGLRFVYAGNLPGHVDELENTRCPKCSQMLIERFGYHILQYNVTPTGTCPSCGATIPGRWAPHFQGQITDHPYLPMLRRRANPLRVLE